MNWDTIKGNWKVYKGQAQQYWADLTDDDLESAKGSKEEFIGVLQRKYGKSRDEASREIDEWLNSVGK